MEFNGVIYINDILLKEITVVVSDNIFLPGYTGNLRSALQYLSSCLDTLGEESAQAQGLNNIITTFTKFSETPGQKLYLLKDPLANDMHGDIVGFLKAGKKHLFLSDEHGKMHEIDPYCVLDFYVKLREQRHGYGKKLFDYMLQDLNNTIDDVAIDGPSIKMVNFLKKNFGVNELLRQANNFAVTKAFFAKLNKTRDNNANESHESDCCRASQPRSAISEILYGPFPVSPQRHITYESPQRGNSGIDYLRPNKDGIMNLPGRFAAPKPSSNMAKILHGASGDPNTENPKSSYGLEQPQQQTGNQGRPTSLAIGDPDTAEIPPAGYKTERRDSLLNKQGYLDLKYHHTKFW